MKPPATTVGLCMGLRVWIDANHPVVRIEMDSATPHTPTVVHETWRTKERVLKGGEVRSCWGVTKNNTGMPAREIAKPAGGEKGRILDKHPLGKSRGIVLDTHPGLSLRLIAGNDAIMISPNYLLSQL